MARLPRHMIFNPDEVGIYHCSNKCVQGLYLCGNDKRTGKDYSHRKQWVEARLKHLAGIFAIDVLNYSVLDDQLHVILRNRPDIAKELSDREVAERWLRINPKGIDAEGAPAPPKPKRVEEIVADKQHVELLRSRLSNISWMMKSWCEYIAREANKEDQTSGHFFADRFKCNPLLDESAWLVCSTYIDLNPIRSEMFMTPETAQYTSAYERIRALKARQRGDTSEAARADLWLAPIFRDPLEELDPSRQLDRSANDNPTAGCLPVTLEQYLIVVQEASRRCRTGPRGKVPNEVVEILGQVGVVPHYFDALLEHLPKWFPRAVGRAPNLARMAERLGQRWLGAIRRSQEVFREPAMPPPQQECGQSS